MYEQVELQHTAPVAVARTAPAADLVATMLQAHGLHAWTEAYAGVYPSVEWVEGLRVLVAAEDAGEAQRVLGALDHADAAAVDPGSDEHVEDVDDVDDDA